MRSLMIKALVMVVLVASGVAVADEASEPDPEGDGAPDLVAASHGHSSQPGSSQVLVHRLTFAEPVEPGELASARIQIWLPDGDRAADRSVSVDYNDDGSFEGAVVGRGIRGYANVFWEDDRTLRIELTERTLKGRLLSYKWRAAVFLRCPPPEVGPCEDSPPEDWVPGQKGKVKHTLTPIPPRCAGGCGYRN